MARSPPEVQWPSVLEPLDSSDFLEPPITESEIHFIDKDKENDKKLISYVGKNIKFRFVSLIDSIALKSSTFLAIHL